MSEGQSIQTICKAIGLDPDGAGIASAWPDFDDGRKARVFVQDPRLRPHFHEGDITELALYRKVLHETLTELAKAFSDE